MIRAAVVSFDIILFLIRIPNIASAHTANSFKFIARDSDSFVTRSRLVGIKCRPKSHSTMFGHIHTLLVTRKMFQWHINTRCRCVYVLSICLFVCFLCPFEIFSQTPLTARKKITQHAVSTYSMPGLLHFTAFLVNSLSLSILFRSPQHSKQLLHTSNT